MRTTSCPSSTSRRAFTLIELLVVIAIISLMIGLGVAVSSRVRQGAANNACKITLGQAQAAADAYAFKFSNTNPIINWLGTGPVENWSNHDKVKNVPGTTDTSASHPIYECDSIERFVYVADQIPECHAQLAAMGKDVFLDSDANGFLDVVDPWGKKLIYRDNKYNLPKYEGQEVVINTSGGKEAGSQLPNHDTPYFASPGADGKWGNWVELQKKRKGQSHDAQQAADAQDNLYSFEIK